MKVPEARTAKFICPSCEVETRHFSINHGRLNKESKPRRHHETLFWLYSVMECQECKNLSLAIETQIHPGSMIGDPYTLKTDYYPAIPQRIKPSWLKKLDKNLRKLLEEVYTASDNSLFSIASTGIRTVLDRIILDKVDDVGGFETKLKKMEQQGLIDSDERDILGIVVEAGSASAHRGFTPNGKVIQTMLDVIEELLDKIYVAPKRRAALQSKAKSLQKKVPPRRRGSTQ